jgi:hypothetical protein
MLIDYLRNRLNHSFNNYSLQYINHLKKEVTNETFFSIKAFGYFI